MLRFKYFTSLIFISLFCVGLFCSSVFAVTLKIDYDSTNRRVLTGAYDVEVVVGEKTYLFDVVFVDNSGDSLFWINDTWDFGSIVNGEMAAAASIALLNQVFLDLSETGVTDQYDSSPNLTYGIGMGSTYAIVLTAFGVYSSSETGTLLSTYSAINNASGDDETQSTNTSSNTNMASESNYVYAVWTVAASTIPEPGTILMVGFGLLSLAGMNRRRN